MAGNDRTRPFLSRKKEVKLTVVAPIGCTPYTAPAYGQTCVRTLPHTYAVVNSITRNWAHLTSKHPPPPKKKSPQKLGEGDSDRRMVRWCIRLTRLTLVCEVIRYRLVQVRQNQKKASKRLSLSLPLSFSPSSYFLYFSIQKMKVIMAGSRRVFVLFLILGRRADHPMIFHIFPYLFYHRFLVSNC